MDTWGGDLKPPALVAYLLATATTGATIFLGSARLPTRSIPIALPNAPNILQQLNLFIDSRERGGL